MKFVIKQSEAKEFSENGVSTFFEYPFSFQNASLGVSEINGRYPQTGYDMDEEVEGIWYVEKGIGTIWIGGIEYSVEQGDIIHVPKGEKFWIEGNNLRLIVASSPLWHPEQHKHIEK